MRERYGAIATRRSADYGCCGDSGANLVGDMYEGVAGHGAEAEANLGLGCGLPTRHAGAREGDTMLGLGAGAGNEAFVARALVGEHGRMIGIDMTAPLATGRGRTPTGSATPTSMKAGMLASFGISAIYEI